MSKAHDPIQYGLRPPHLTTAFGSTEIARRVVFHGWLKPVLQQKKLTLFDSGDVAQVWQRIRNGEVPPPIPRKVLTVGSI
jgi:hypothetical protein